MYSSEFPKISIITPSLNQGRFLERTIQSILSQGYPNLELIIMDGGSTDETLNILKRYDSQITYWESKPDNGQSDAINRGIQKSSGDILGWLNSDDMYCPGALLIIANTFQALDCDVVTGTTVYVNEDGELRLGLKNPGEISIDDMLLTCRCSSPQPSTFWNRKSWERYGPLLPELHLRMDYAFFLCLAASDLGWVVIDDEIAFFRLHDSQKTDDWSSPLLHAESLEAIEHFSSYDEFSTKFSNQIKRAYYYEGWLHRWMPVNEVYKEGWKYKARLLLAPFFNWRCLVMTLYYKKVLGSVSSLMKLQFVRT